MRVSHHQHQAPATGFVDPRTLARIDNLELVARFVVDGFINGLHRSPYLGLSLDFAEHRPYMPGDDIRRIDWRLWARTDRYFVKEFEADTNANFMVLLDVSKSMNYGSMDVTKIDYARFLAASLTYFSSQQRDRVGIVTFDQDIVQFVPPSAKHLNVVLHTIDRATTDRASALGPALKRAAGALNRRGILVLISDLYEDADAVFEAIKPLRFKGNDLIVFHVLDPAEIEFPFEGASSFEDMESGQRIPVVPETQRTRYQELIRNHIARLNKVFTDNRIDYHLFDTSTPLDHALFTYLSKREQLQRTR